MLIEPGFPFCVNSSFARDDLPRMPAVHGRGGSVREITEGQAVHWTLAHHETSRLELIYSNDKMMTSAELKSFSLL